MNKMSETTEKRFTVNWIDFKREPQCAPDARYPDGIELDASMGRFPSCKADLPYPAKRCGLYHVKCLECGETALVTTAGRPDDPKSVTLPCKIERQ